MGNLSSRLLISAVMLVMSIAAGFFCSSYLNVSSAFASSSSLELSAPYRIFIKGGALSGNAVGRLNVDLKKETEERAVEFNKRMIVGSVVFNRFQGSVTASGSLSDGMGPRAVAIILDAYAEDGEYLSSSRAQGVSSPQNLDFKVSMADFDYYDRFAIRMLDAEGSEIKLGSISDINEEITSLSMQTSLIPSDFRSLADMLRSLGYLNGSGYPEAIEMVSLIGRFRSDHDLDTLDPRITLGDFYMVMIASKKSPEFVLGRYYQTNVDRSRKDMPEISPSASLVARESKKSSVAVIAPIDESSEAIILTDEVPNE